MQALNSNDAESPSGTFRPQMNSMLHKENAENQRQQSHMFRWQTNAQLCRPIAKIFPSITAKSRYDKGVFEVVLTKDTKPQSLQEESSIEEKREHTKRFQPKYRNRLCYFTKRKILSSNLRLCQKPIQDKTSVGYSANQSIESTTLRGEKNVADDYKENPKEKYTYKQINYLQFSSKINKTGNNENIFTKFDENTITDSKRKLKRPLVDGKVVSMLRRLGTTLSHEIFDKSTNSSTPFVTQIMSPTKSKPRWTRQLNDDEILLDFNSAISEVLPQVIGEQKPKVSDKYCVPEIMAVKQAKRKLTYQVSVDEYVSQYIYPVLPEGLSISLV